MSDASFPGFMLTPILIITTSIAMFTTGCLIGLFLATRLYILTRDADFSLAIGLQRWFEETKSRILQMIPAQTVEVKQVVIHGSEAETGEEGEIDVKRVELQLMNGSITKEVDNVAVVVDEKADGRVKAQTDGYSARQEGGPYAEVAHAMTA
jgi:hypothetical protein